MQKAPKADDDFAGKFPWGYEGIASLKEWTVASIVFGLAGIRGGWQCHKESFEADLDIGHQIARSLQAMMRRSWLIQLDPERALMGFGVRYEAPAGHPEDSPVKSSRSLFTWNYG